MPQMFTVGSNRYFNRSWSFGKSNLNFAVRSSWSHADGSNVFASVLTIAESAFDGGTTSSQIPSIAGRWFSSTSVLRAWTNRHTGEPIHTAFELWISLSIGPPACGIPRDQTVRYRHPLPPRQIGGTPRRTSASTFAHAASA